MTALIPDFTITGVDITVDGISQTSGVTPNDFTGIVVYSVIAEDSSTKEYSVLIDPEPPLIVATPVLSPDNVSFVNSITVIITTTTGNATIVYTTDGSLPTSSNGIQVSSLAFVTLTNTTTLRAMAINTGWTDSSVVQSTYTRIVPDSTVADSIQTAIDAAADNDIIFVPEGITMKT